MTQSNNTIKCKQHWANLLMSQDKTVYILLIAIAVFLEIISLEMNVRLFKRESLIIFDEIQEAPKALASLKYFYENAPQYAIIAAGSLLGVALHQGTSFPVGKVDFMHLYPFYM